MLKKIIGLLKALNGNSHPGEIAHAICLALVLGLIPKNNALFYIVTVFCLFIRINKIAFVLMTTVFSLLGHLIDPMLDTIGWWFLNLEFLKPAFSAMLEIPFVGFTHFNNTIVAGAIVTGLVLYIPLYWLSRLLIWGLRAKLIPILRKTKLLMAISKIPLIQKIMDISASV
ncbi:MAG: TIGR03546 family protein [Treponema sp.]|nr:TIGR03546 family protein [Treponema sp.]